MLTGTIGGVRVATGNDERALMDLCLKAHAECGFGGFDADKVIAQIRVATDQDYAWCGVLDGADGIEGAILLRMTQWWYGPGWRVEDLFLYVRQQFRSRARFDALAAFARWICDSINTNGVTNIPLIIGVFQTDRAEAKSRLYGAQFRFVGENYIYGPTERGLMGAR